MTSSLLRCVRFSVGVLMLPGGLAMVLPAFIPGASEGCGRVEGSPFCALMTWGIGLWLVLGIRSGSLLQAVPLSWVITADLIVAASLIAFSWNVPPMARDLIVPCFSPWAEWFPYYQFAEVALLVGLMAALINCSSAMASGRLRGWLKAFRLSVMLTPIIVVFYIAPVLPPLLFDLIAIVWIIVLVVSALAVCTRSMGSEVISTEDGSDR